MEFETILQLFLRWNRVLSVRWWERSHTLRASNLDFPRIHRLNSSNLLHGQLVIRPVLNLKIHVNDQRGLSLLSSINDHANVSQMLN